LDITDSSPQRTEVVVEQFLAGGLLEYEGVQFSRHSGTTLEVSCFSNGAPEFSTPTQAVKAIARAKAVLEQLVNLNSSFRVAIESLPHQFYYCYNYGNGSVALAKESSGRFEWLKQ
jgi:hypothetical protein